MQSTITSDRLYGISMRPHELAIHGEQVAFTLRYSPIFDDPEEQTTSHYTLLVLEIHADVAFDDEPPKRLQLAKCGWEMSLTTPAACQVGSLAEQPTEVPMLLSRIAETINDLARRAGLEAPLGPVVVDDLLKQYRGERSAQM